MHRCFNNLEIFPSLKSQEGNLAGALSFCPKTTIISKKSGRVSNWETSKMKSSKEFDKMGLPAKGWSSFLTRTALHE